MNAQPIDVAALYHQRRRSLLRLAQSLVDDVTLAEDIVQDSFAALFAKQHRLAGQDSAAAYLHTCVVNGARSALRRRRTVRSAIPFLGAAGPAPAADHVALLSAEHAAVRQTLSTLPRRQREVLGLRFLCDLDDVEIADVTGTSHANVRSAASRGLATLRAAQQTASAPKEQS